MEREPDWIQKWAERIIADAPEVMADDFLELADEIVRQMGGDDSKVERLKAVMREAAGELGRGKDLRAEKLLREALGHRGTQDANG